MDELSEEALRQEAIMKLQREFHQKLMDVFTSYGQLQKEINDYHVFKQEQNQLQSQLNIFQNEKAES